MCKVGLVGMLGLAGVLAGGQGDLLAWDLPCVHTGMSGPTCMCEHLCRGPVLAGSGVSSGSALLSAQGMG